MKNNYLSFLKEHKDIIGETKGLHTNEIQSIERKFNVTLPVAYKQFLSYFGYDSGNLLSSYLVTQDKLDDNRDSALDASFDEMDNVRVEVKDTFFFFAQWQGYNIFFFDCSSHKENPEVYLLTDTPEIIKYKESFTDFLNDEGLQLLIQSHNQRP